MAKRSGGQRARSRKVVIPRKDVTNKAVFVLLVLVIVVGVVSLVLYLQAANITESALLVNTGKASAEAGQAGKYQPEVVTVTQNGEVTLTILPP